MYESQQYTCYHLRGRMAKSEVAYRLGEKKAERERERERGSIRESKYTCYHSCRISVVGWLPYVADIEYVMTLTSKSLIYRGRYKTLSPDREGQSKLRRKRRYLFDSNNNHGSSTQQ